MIHHKKVLEKLNDLVLVNAEAKNVYEKLIKNVTNDILKKFFKEKGAQRNQFNLILFNEVKKINGEDIENPIILNKRFDYVTLNQTNIMYNEKDKDLLNIAYKIEKICIEKYNELLMEMNMPLSFCRLLIKQRDNIIQCQSHLNVNNRKEVLFV